MKIKVNGNEIVFYKKTLQDLVEQYKLQPTKIVIEKNGEVVHRDRFKEEILQEGDTLEIVRFVGGG